jgi:hypothetical protein
VLVARGGDGAHGKVEFGAGEAASSRPKISRPTPVVAEMTAAVLLTRMPCLRRVYPAGTAVRSEGIVRVRLGANRSLADVDESLAKGLPMITEHPRPLKLIAAFASAPSHIGRFGKCDSAPQQGWLSYRGASFNIN